MSANNQFIIRKGKDDLFYGLDVDVDAYGEPENQDYYDSKPFIFVAATLEEAIHKYYDYCDELAEVGMYIEYGLAFEGI